MHTLIKSAVLLSTLVFVFPTTALAMTLDDKVRIQSALVSHIETHSTNGQYKYVDTESGTESLLYPTNLHPKILDFGKLLLLCADFIDGAGVTVEVDFIASMQGNEVVIGGAYLDKRKAVVKRLISEFGKPK